MVSQENLTKVQNAKWRKFLDAYPKFVVDKTITLSTAQIGKIIGSKSCDVMRDLNRVSRRLGHLLRVQIVIPDARNRFFPATSQDIVNIRKIRGGRQKNTSKEQGLRGNAIWLRIWLEK